MGGKLKTAGQIAGVATVAFPVIRQLLKGGDTLSALKDLGPSSRRLRRTRRRALFAGCVLGFASGFAAGALLSPSVRAWMRRRGSSEDVWELPEKSRVA